MPKLKSLAQWRAEQGLLKETDEPAGPEVHLNYARRMLDQNVGKLDYTVVRKLKAMLQGQQLQGMDPNEQFATLVTSAAAAVYPDIAQGKNVPFQSAGNKVDQEAGMADPVV